MTPRQKRITEKVLSLIDWLEKSCPVWRIDMVEFNHDLQRKLDEIKLESFAAEQLEEDENSSDTSEKYYEYVANRLKNDGF